MLKTKVKTNGSGTAKIYVLSKGKSYYAYILTIKVNKPPVKKYTCEGNVGITCDTYWYDKSEGFTYKISKGGIANLYSITANSRTGREKLEITGIKEGTTEIYVYKLGEHRATIKVNIIPKVPLKVSDSIIKIKENQSTEIQISGGGGYYKTQDYDNKIIYVDINKYTGKLKIKGLKTGSSYIRILDKYNQSTTVKVIVKAKKLSVSTSDRKIKLNKGKKYLVAIYDYYGTISLKRSNNNISIYFKKGENGTDYVEVTVLKGGESVFEIKDSRGDSVSVEVNGGEKVEEKVEEEEKIKEEENDKLDKIVTIQKTQYLKKIQNTDGSNVISFVVRGNPKEVGVKFDGKTQVLEKNKIGIYILTCKNSCPTQVQPYVINSENIISYEKNDYSGYVVMEGNKFQTIASVGDGVEINDTKEKARTIANKFSNLLVNTHKEGYDTGVGSAIIALYHYENYCYFGIKTKNCDNDIPVTDLSIKFLEGAGIYDILLGETYSSTHYIGLNENNNKLYKYIKLDIDNKRAYFNTNVPSEYMYIRGYLAASSSIIKYWKGGKKLSDGKRYGMLTKDKQKYINKTSKYIKNFHLERMLERTFNGVVKCKLRNNNKISTSEKTFYTRPKNGHCVKPHEENNLGKNIFGKEAWNCNSGYIENTRTHKCEKDNGLINIYVKNYWNSEIVYFKKDLNIYDLKGGSDTEFSKKINEEWKSYAKEAADDIIRKKPLLKDSRGVIEAKIINNLKRKIYSQIAKEGNLDKLLLKRDLIDNYYGKISGNLYLLNKKVSLSSRTYRIKKIDKMRVVLKGVYNKRIALYCTNNKKECDKRELSKAGTLVSWTPFIGEGYDVLTLLMGKDPLTGEKVENYEKALIFLGLASGVGSGKASKDGVNKLLKELGEKYGLKASEVVQIANDILKKYNLTSIDDLIKLKNDLNIDKFLLEFKKKAKILKNRVNITDVTRKVKERIGHIMKIDIKTLPDGSKKFTGVHSRKAIENYPNGARIDLLSDADKIRKKNNQPYNAKVYAKDEKGNEIQKDGFSTFFPDNWDEKKILEEVEYAVKNNSGKIEGTKNTYKGISKSGMEIHFFLNKDGSIPSFFPYIK